MLLLVSSCLLLLVRHLLLVAMHLFLLASVEFLSGAYTDALTTHLILQTGAENIHCSMPKTTPSASHLPGQPCQFHSSATVDGCSLSWQLRTALSAFVQLEARSTPS